MDWLVIAFVGLQAILLAAAVGVAIGRGRTLEAIREMLDRPVGDDVAPSVRRLVDRAAEAEFRLAEQRRDLAYLADLMGHGIVRVDDDLQLEVANTAAHVLLDRPAGSMVGRSAIEAFVDRRIEEIVAAARDGGSAGGEVTVREVDGPTVVIRARRSPIRGVWVVFEDVSELRRLQQIRAEFIDNLSHELRTPLTTISLLAETLVREADAAGETIPPRIRERIARIEVETGHIVQMINELLDLSRIEGGGAIVHLDDVDLGRLATASAERLRLFAERQGVRLRVELAGEIPRVRGDEGRLGQVLVNLLHNAVKFSPDGGDVTVRVGADGGEVVVAVADQGIGIPRGALPRIFERFYKVDRARARAGGTGLGLAIARHVVAQHGGRIWVESEEGRGSVFSLALPAAEEPG